MREMGRRETEFWAKTETMQESEWRGISGRIYFEQMFVFINQETENLRTV